MILTDEAEGVYLDKFAVLDDAQGEGLGRAVWNVMLEETPQLFWRSRNGNPVNHFYYSESDGCYKLDHWKVFWFGADDFDSIKGYVKHCAERKPSPPRLSDAAALGHCVEHRADPAGPARNAGAVADVARAGVAAGAG